MLQKDEKVIKLDVILLIYWDISLQLTITFHQNNIEVLL
jgi:hypothetical protein